MESNRPKTPKAAWVVVFRDTLHAPSVELEVFTSRDRALAAAKGELDPGWRSDLYRIYLDEHHGSWSEEPLPEDAGDL